MKTLVKVNNLSKKFCKNLKHSLYYGVRDTITELTGIGFKTKKTLRKKEFWALKDVSFELKRGQCLGIIGKNGAGKSTLLKILNGLIKPDEGTVEMHGRINALLELGSGFNPILSGKENIYINASILGMKKSEIDSIVDEIIDFAELEEFIDTPVQYYSSGMKSRLGFSVAAHLKPDILILDEVLATGDAGFKMKSLNQMHQLINTCAVIFVNHSMNTIARVCDKVMFIETGKIKYFGTDVAKGIELYLSTNEVQKGFIEYNKEAQFITTTVRSNKNRGFNEKNLPIIYYGDDIIIDLEYTLSKIIDEYQISLTFHNKDMISIASYYSNIFKNNDSFKKFSIIIPNSQIANGEYYISIKISSPYNSATIKNYATYRYWVGFYMFKNPIYTSTPFLLSGNVQSTK